MLDSTRPAHPPAIKFSKAFFLGFLLEDAILLYSTDDDQEEVVDLDVVSFCGAHVAT